MISTSYCQIELKRLKFQNEQGMWLNEAAMDEVYNKYLSFDSLEIDHQKLLIKYEIKHLQLVEKQDELDYKIANFNTIVKEKDNQLNIKETQHKAKVKKVRSNGNKKGILGIVLGFILSIVLIK